jgi:uncharacterized protein YqhQ
MTGRLRWLWPVARAAFAAPLGQVGGQAVIEGVMMRSVRHWSVAVRTPDREIIVVDHEIAPLAARRKWLRLPVIRGVVALGESLVIGMKALSISATEAAGEDEETGQDVLSRTAVGLTLTLSLSIAVGLFFLLPLFLTKTFFDFKSGVAFWAVEGSIELGIFLLYLWALSFMPDLRRVFQYHAAEHMAIHAYEAGEPIEAESASRFSQLHVRCGTAFLLIVMVMAILVFGAIGKHAIWIMALTRVVAIPLIAGLSYEVIRWAGLNKERRAVQRIMTPGLWLQHLTTRKPEIEHLEVSCVALNRVLELEADPPEWAAEVEVMA